VVSPPEITIPTEKLTSFATVPYTGEFPLSALTPGNYVLELTVTDRTRKASAIQHLNFSIY